MYFIIDIDGTVADSSHRRDAINNKYGLTAKDKWGKEQADEFCNPDEIAKDKPLVTPDVFGGLRRTWYANFVFITARSITCKYATAKWIIANLGLPIYLFKLLMRPENDFSLVADCKEDILNNLINEGGIDLFHNDLVFIEDEPECIEMWSKHGLVLKAPECWSVIR